MVKNVKPNSRGKKVGPGVLTEFKKIPAGTTQQMLAEMDIETLRTYGYVNYSQIHIPIDAMQKLNTKEWLAKKIKTDPVSVIAKELGVTFPTVMRRICLFGLREQYEEDKIHHGNANARLKVSLEVSEQIRSKEWLEEAIKTKSVSDIAKELGVGTALVYRMLYKFELSDLYNSGHQDRMLRKLDTCSRRGCNNRVMIPRNKYCSKECRAAGQRDTWMSTCTERYDVANPINIAGARQKHTETMLARHGVEHANQSDVLMKRMPDKEDVLAKINSKEWMESSIKTKPITQIAMELDVDKKLVMRHIKRLGLFELYKKVKVKVKE